MSDANTPSAPPLSFPLIEDWERWKTAVCASLMTWTEDRTAEGMERYAAALAVWARLMPAPPPTPLSGQGTARGVEFGVVGFERPLMVSRWKMAAGAVQPPHCHPHTVNCTLVTDGEVHMTSFDVVETPPPFTDHETAFDLRCVGEVLPRAGHSATLTPVRCNLHLIEAGPAGAEGFEFTTMYARTHDFSYVQWLAPRCEPPLVGTRAAARWVGPHPPERPGIRSCVQ